MVLWSSKGCLTITEPLSCSVKILCRKVSSFVRFGVAMGLFNVPKWNLDLFCELKQFVSSMEEGNGGLTLLSLWSLKSIMKSQSVQASIIESRTIKFALLAFFFRGKMHYVPVKTYTELHLNFDSKE